MDPPKLHLQAMAKTVASIMITQPDIKARTAMVMAGYSEQDAKKRQWATLCQTESVARSYSKSRGLLHLIGPKSMPQILLQIFHSQCTKYQDKNKAIWKRPNNRKPWTLRIETRLSYGPLPLYFSIVTPAKISMCPKCETIYWNFS